MARDMFDDGDFVEIFVDIPIEEAERRDLKGLYKKAKSGELLNFTGVDSPYEIPENPEIILHNTENGAEDCAELVIDWIRNRGYV